MIDENDHEGTDATEAFEAMRGELALLRRAVEGLAAERGAIDMPDYSETLGVLQQGVGTVIGRIDHVVHILSKTSAMTMTPEQMAQRISAAGSAARRDDQAALAKAGEDKARIMAEIRAIAGSAWTRADQKNRQLWFGLGGIAIGIIAWSIIPGLVAREVALTNWQWPERMAARTLDLPRWEAGQRMMQSASPNAFRTIVAADKIVTANRQAIEKCSMAAARTHETVRCTIKIGSNP